MQPSLAVPRLQTSLDHKTEGQMQKQMVPARGLAQSGRHHLPKQRILNPAEADGLLVIRQIITRLLGRARKPGQTLYFGVPAPAFGVNDDKFTFHETTLRECLRELGYEPKSISEGLAVVYGELGDSNFTGIGVSCGGGMCNVCLAYLSVPVISFSVAKGRRLHRLQFRLRHPRSGH